MPAIAASGICDIGIERDITGISTIKAMAASASHATIR